METQEQLKKARENLEKRYYALAGKLYDSGHHHSLKTKKNNPRKASFTTKQ